MLPKLVSSNKAPGGEMSTLLAEPRLGGIRRVEVDFNDVVALLGTVYVENLTDGGTITADDAYVTDNGDGTSTLVIVFNPGTLLDMKCYEIDLADNISGLIGDTDCRIVALEGDNHRSDLDVDGNITLTDYLKAKDLNAHAVTCP